MLTENRNLTLFLIAHGATLTGVRRRTLGVREYALTIDETKARRLTKKFERTELDLHAAELAALEQQLRIKIRKRRR